MVAAFGLDERPVGHGPARAGGHGPKAQGAMVQHGRVDLGHVPADERWVKRVGKRVGRARARAVPARVWLGGSSVRIATAG